jgi:hypothetical protein
MASWQWLARRCDPGQTSRKCHAPNTSPDKVFVILALNHAELALLDFGSEDWKLAAATRHCREPVEKVDKQICHTRQRNRDWKDNVLSGNQEWAYAGRGETSHDPLESQGGRARQHHPGGHARHLFQSKIPKTRSTVARDR